MLTVPALINPHSHLREGEPIEGLLKLAIEGGASVIGPMPNTAEGLLTARQVRSYLNNLKRFIPDDVSMQFIPIVQFTEATTRSQIDACINAGIRDAKVYPYKRTTKSNNGVRGYTRILPIVEYAGKRGMRVHFHPEHPNMLFDNSDAEWAFLPIMDFFMTETETTLVWEHGTDARCIPFWEEWAASGRFYVTITAHHLLSNESGAYGDVGSVCKPSYKKEVDRRGLVELIGKDYSWVMAGGDDAPHPKESKHTIGPCACGAYTAPFLLALYAHALSHLLVEGEEDSQYKKETFENFTSSNAARLYDLRWDSEMKLINEPFQIPELYQAGPWVIEPFWAGRTIHFRTERMD